MFIIAKIQYIIVIVIILLVKSNQKSPAPHGAGLDILCLLCKKNADFTLKDEVRLLLILKCSPRFEDHHVHCVAIIFRVAKLIN